ncbi:MAG: ABC transporter ATP-binding protein/permease [Anaerolineae bacterium]|jgi:ATP-binding cassette subfamily B protein|nr:ABC transporter ATP-binding protein/permease [Anaerolineae bacterium]
MAQKSEFTVQNAYVYNTSSPFRWIFSHVWRYKILLIGAVLMYLTAWFSFSYTKFLFGAAAEEIVNPTGPDGLVLIALAILFFSVMDGLSALGGSLSLETIAQRLSRDGRQELYENLLAKSQTFHDQQRVGDIMARSTDDINNMNMMINPGVLFIAEMVMGLTVPVLMIAAIRWELLLVPIVFIVTYIITVRPYSARLQPVVNNQREAFGVMNAGLEESISGIEVVKASARETFERFKFRRHARAYREYFAEQGRVEALYLPMLLYGFALGAIFLHAMLIYQREIPLGLSNPFGIAEIIAVMSLAATLRFPIFISVFSFSLIQLGIASGGRVLKVISAESDMDENAVGHSAPIVGEIVFENVSFGYEGGSVLQDISFRIAPGQTVAIVGQTGSGKSTLTDLINRTYDVRNGRILIDGVDARQWSLQSLRSQISRIEQDVFLFSRTIAENIAFGAPEATQAQIEQAAREAQAHEFITSFSEGYQTKVGERGVTLSGGQRQRIALARAFLSNPRILILDDSTSAIDSATEDEIQKAIRRAQQGRTTLLITHRLSQIRWADQIIVLDQGRISAQGSHEELLRHSPQYRRIFARYDAALPEAITGD